VIWLGLVRSSTPRLTGPHIIAERSWGAASRNVITGRRNPSATGLPWALRLGKLRIVDNSDTRVRVQATYVFCVRLVKSRFCIGRGGDCP